MKEYNLHCLLYDLTRGHFKSKLLCKLGCHNYMIKIRYKLIKTEENDEPYVKVVINKRRFTKYYECYCCKKEISLEE